MYKKLIAKFWNNPEQVKRFGEDQPSEYLVKFFSMIKNPADKKVLDIGCGGGRNIEILLKMRFDIFACDLHRKMVESTKKRIMKINKKEAKKIILASMLFLPYHSNFFDYVVSNGVFHNAKSVNEFKLAIKESARVLKDNGELVLNMFSSRIIDPKLKLMKGEKFIYITRQGLPLVLLSRQYLTKILRENRLYVIDKITEKETVVSTGKRAVLRGIFKKNK